jgi:uncharacterized protein YprB with RNaseH-like and TPR domain
MSYSKQATEYIMVRMAQTDVNLHIAREIHRKFHPEKELDTIRKHVANTRKKTNIQAQRQPIKRLFFDIETSYLVVRSWGIYKQTIRPENVIQDKRIICISYKWQGEDKIHTLTWNQHQNDKKMIKAFINVMGEASEIVAHNGDKFDIRELRTRAIANNVLMYPTYRTLDTLSKSRQYFKFTSNKLDYIGKYLNVGKKLEHEGMNLWVKVVEHNDKNALKRMVEYCEQDVILLEDAYFAISPYIYHNNNFAVLKGGKKWHCPECASSDVELCHTYTTAMGIIRRNMKCNNCAKQYRVSNKTYMSMLESVIE